MGWRWVEVILIEPFQGGYPPVAAGCHGASTNGSTETAEDLERRHLTIALRDMKALHPKLYEQIEQWLRDHDSEKADEALEWLENRIDLLLS